MIYFKIRWERGWKQIITKIDKGWTKREDIFQNIYDFVVKRVGEFNLEAFPKRYTINIQEILEHSYPNAKVPQGDIDKYWNALNENDKDTMHEYGMKIGELIAKSCQSFKLEDTDVRKKFCMILKKQPEILLVLRKYLGEHFEEVVKESVEGWSKEK